MPSAVLCTHCSEEEGRISGCGWPYRGADLGGWTSRQLSLVSVMMVPCPASSGHLCSPLGTEVPTPCCSWFLLLVRFQLFLDAVWLQSATDCALLIPRQLPSPQLYWVCISYRTPSETGHGCPAGPGISQQCLQTLEILGGSQIQKQNLIFVTLNAGLHELDLSYIYVCARAVRRKRLGNAS